MCSKTVTEKMITLQVRANCLYENKLTTGSVSVIQICVVRQTMSQSYTHTLKKRLGLCSCSCGKLIFENEKILSC